MTLKGPRRVRFHSLDVFTEQRFGGNPLAVVTAAAGLTTEQMQRIAAEFNLSETAFVLPPEHGGTHRVRIFTPASEMPFAGHPTVGTALLLRELESTPLERPEQYQFEEGVGRVAVGLRLEDGRPFAELEAALPVDVQPAPVGLADLASVLSLAAEDLDSAAPGPVVASCGVPFLLVPLRSVEALGRARLDTARWKATLAGTAAQNVFPYVTDGSEGASVRARMFAPAHGIPEDPATGGAVTALVGLFGTLDSRRTARQWTVVQGVEMGRTSTLYARYERRPDRPTALFVGGRAVRMSQGELWL